MKYTILIAGCAAVFTILGLVAAFGACKYGVDPGRPEQAFMAFMLLPFGGAVAGLVVGGIVAFVGHWFSQRDSEQPKASA